MNSQFISKQWYACAYEQFENQTNDVEFLIGLLNKEFNGVKLNILEVACGGGRISVPLAEAGHKVTGFDADEYMLSRFYRRIKDLPDIRCYRANALSENWGGGYDVVVLGGNILINIETETDYIEAQEIFIRKAAEVLRPGGYLFLDYDQHSESSAVKFFNRLNESGRGDDTVYTDESGTSGKILNYGNIYDPVTQICVWVSHRDLLTNNGEQMIISTAGRKHIPMLKQVYGWLDGAGFSVEKAFRNYSDEPLDERESESVRASIWARKD